MIFDQRMVSFSRHKRNRGISAEIGRKNKKRVDVSRNKLLLQMRNLHRHVLEETGIRFPSIFFQTEDREALQEQPSDEGREEWIRDEHTGVCLLLVPVGQSVDGLGSKEQVREEEGREKAKHEPSDTVIMHGWNARKEERKEGTIRTRFRA